jgi:hypothetical protein
MPKIVIQLCQFKHFDILFGKRFDDSEVIIGRPNFLSKKQKMIGLDLFEKLLFMIFKRAIKQ